MYLADYHVHSRVSPDSRAPMSEMAAAAVAAGMQELCFTDHLEPVIWRRGKCPADYDWSILEREFAQVQAHWGERIRLRLGIELGDAPFNLPHTESLMARAPALDFIIGSIHLLTDRVTDVDLYHFAPADEAQARRGIEDYLELVWNLATWGQFSVLGHLTLPLRYFNQLRGFHLTFDRYGAEVEDILRALIQRGCGIELNTNRGSTPLPDERWLRLYRRLGGEIITLGSDAHQPDTVGCAIRERQALLRECGFIRFCTFDHLEPVWHQL